MFACAAALCGGVLLGALHAAQVDRTRLVDGQSYEVAVQLTSAPRPHEAAGRTWWSADGRIAAGADEARVSLSGNGDLAASMGDTLIARMVAGPPFGRGRSASLRVVGTAQVVPAHGPAATARVLMRQVAGNGDAGWLLSGMTLGSDQGLSPVAADDMRASGLTHLTAVSGANCAILLALVHWLGGWLHIRAGHVHWRRAWYSERSWWSSDRSRASCEHL
jgi:hypothetical protein